MRRVPDCQSRLRPARGVIHVEVDRGVLAPRLGPSVRAPGRRRFLLRPQASGAKSVDGQPKVRTATPTFRRPDGEQVHAAGSRSSPHRQLQAQRVGCSKERPPVLSCKSNEREQHVKVVEPVEPERPLVPSCESNERKQHAKADAPARQANRVLRRGSLVPRMHQEDRFRLSSKPGARERSDFHWVSVAVGVLRTCGSTCLNG